MFDGGLVSEALRHPRGKELFAVRAVWTRISIDTKAQNRPLLHHIKGDLFVGTWKLTGIENHSKLPREIIAVVEPTENSQTIEAGDVMVLGGGAVSRYATNTLKPKISTPVAVEVGEGKLRGILSRSTFIEAELLVFHNPSEDISASDLRSLRDPLNKFDYAGIFSYVSTTIARYTPSCEGDITISSPRVGG
jgi:hypothetical protein